MAYRSCENCGNEFVTRENGLYCSPLCRTENWKRKKKEEATGKVRVPAGSVHLWARPGFADWSESSSQEVIVSAVDAARIDQLPKGRLAIRSRPVTRLPRDYLEVMDFASGSRVRVRRGQCGLGPCACALQVWPADGPDPRPDPFDWFELHLDDEDAG